MFTRRLISLKTNSDQLIWRSSRAASFLRRLETWEMARPTGNLNSANRRYRDGDATLDGQVDVLGDAFILIGNLD